MLDHMLDHILDHMIIHFVIITLYKNIKIRKNCKS